MVTGEAKAWWHYYGAEIPVGVAVIGRAAIALGQEGPPTFAIALVQMDVGPDGVRAGTGSPVKSPVYIVGQEFPEYALQYLASWDHAPIPAEINAATPAKWRDPSDLN